jgi:hypothetical protein
VEERLGRVSGKMPVAKALRYLLNHWDGLGVFLDDGRVEIDSNSIERRHRVVATVRRNSLFAGSDAGARSWAIFTSLIQTARLTDVLERMASGAVKTNEYDRLLPWNWKVEHAEGRARRRSPLIPSGTTRLGLHPRATPSLPQRGALLTLTQNRLDRVTWIGHIMCHRHAPV